MGRRWYAIEHRYGAHVCDNDGDHIGAVHAFLTKAERERWVANSLTDHSDQAGFRAPLTFTDATDRAAIRRWKKDFSQSSM